MALNRDVVVAAGLEILDAYGLGDLSMRRVAERLEVQPGALYYHVANKQSMLAAVSDRILEHLPLLDPHLEPATWLHRWASGLRAAVLQHRDGAELVASTLALGLGEADVAGPGARVLARAGDPAPHASMEALTHFVLGHATTEQTRTQLTALGVVAGFDAEAAQDDFDHGLQVFIRGVTNQR